MSTDPSASAPRECEIFLAALEHLVPEERATYLAQACDGDPALRAAVDTLLKNHKDDAFLENTPVGFTAALPPAAEGVGEHIGRYKLLQKIGEGGYGTVFMAEQEKPVRRRVALKIIKLGMDTAEVIARFEAERQALAMMEHPHIARVLDAGATPAGRPFFVMEFVRGVNITDYCDQNNLPTEARVKLFISVCQAIQHAHQKGIIHRDIKPSNILVTQHDGTPMIKVIDFGIAKATGGRLTDKTMFTAFDQFIGTPAYMSPEQAELSGIDIDTRSDIYSLGILLYELLTGRPPFDPKSLISAGLDEVRRLIREVEPPKPSTRLSTLPVADRATVANLRATESPKLVRLVQGDLDWIVMKCLEKSRQRRYETANDLARDLGRHLASEPIYARPPSLVYRCRKFLRRRRVAVVSVAAVVIALVAGSLVPHLWQRPPGPDYLRSLELALAPPDSDSPLLAKPMPYDLPADQTITLDLSNWPGFAGIVAANGGMEPNDRSYFSRFGFKVRITFSDDEKISQVNAGKLAGTSVSADMLAFPLTDMQLLVPVQFDYSDGGDSVIVRSELNSIPDLKGKILITGRFTESEFYLRALARQAGIKVKMLGKFADPPDQDMINLIFCKDPVAAGGWMQKAVLAKVDRLVGVVTFEPQSSEVVNQSAGAAKVLVNNRGSRLIADVLVLNRSFAKGNPKIVAGLVAGIIEGNRQMQTPTETNLRVVMQAFDWRRDEALRMLGLVHFSDLRDNHAFLEGSAAVSGSLKNILQEAVAAYDGLIHSAPVADSFVDASFLPAVTDSPAGAGVP